ncbi:MAG: RsmE family RNA methyltransferase [Myxococcota bacterium]|nr:RsmE family RNA methyltransferase [Myxococcota bacterium]
MSKKRYLWLPEIQTGKIVLPREQSHYLTRVLRLSPGEEIEVFDDQRRIGTAKLFEVKKNETTAHVGPIQLVREPQCLVRIALPPPKNDRLEWIVQKLAELGCHEIIFMETHRTVTSLEKIRGKRERLLKIARSATEQSGHCRVPILDTPVSFNSLLTKYPNVTSVFCHPEPHDISLKLQEIGKLDSILIAIGPEGGFTDDELEQFGQKGFTSLRLTETTLRVETAALLAASLPMLHATHFEP